MKRRAMQIGWVTKKQSGERIGYGGGEAESSEPPRASESNWEEDGSSGRDKKQVWGG